MSSSEPFASIIQELQIFTRENYIGLAVFAVVIYDWILTFPDEVRIMWKRPLTGSKVLFFINRYIIIVDNITNIMFDLVSGANRSCSSLGISTLATSVLHNVVVSVFQILRVYAISGRRKRYAFLISVLLIFPNLLPMYEWAMSIFSSSPPPFQGCFQITLISETTFNKLFITERVCLIVADAIVVLVTVHHTYGTVKASRQANVRSTFSSTILNAGIVYFSVMFAMNTVDFIVLLTTSNDYFSSIAGLFDYLIISHFLLNLQAMSTATTEGSNPSDSAFVHSTRAQMSSIRFADMVIGNLGESLRDGSRDDEEDDEADDDGMARIVDIEMGPLPHRDGEESEHRTLPISPDILEENVAGPSRLPLDVLRNRNISTGRSTEMEMHV